jgi:hypothetical protein
MRSQPTDPRGRGQALHRNAGRGLRPSCGLRLSLRLWRRTARPWAGGELVDAYGARVETEHYLATKCAVTRPRRRARGDDLTAPFGLVLP